MIFEVHYGGDSPLVLEGFGPNTVIGALKDIIKEGGILRMDGMKVDQVVIREDRETDATER